jgi:O-antigen/teichoic acid export membrane protein
MDDSHQQHLRRGFNWLGSALIVAKLTDFATILVVLRLLTKEQVGAASLVVAFGTVIEALDGLGTSTALVQAPSLSRLQLNSLFWFIVGAACVVAGVTLLAAPWIASLYGIAGVGAYFLAVAIKQPLVAAAVIPLAIMNRELQYERIAIVNVGSTFAAALSRSCGHGGGSLGDRDRVCGQRPVHPRRSAVRATVPTATAIQ